ncbi:NLR family CARD domain-containing protein 4-like [Macrobrachium rosenbergii]|uniref:NLR family CARD domain-containing protein 4-like n=1 Tax=Macrobrachium rosenbergii TaxID=79674 RepID=UPI0034D5C602
MRAKLLAMKSLICQTLIWKVYSETFKQHSRKRLRKTKSLFPKHSADIDLLKAEIQNAVPKLQEKIREKYDSSNPQDVQRLKEELKEFGSELFDMIQESSEAELLSLNERLCQILPYDWLAQYGTTDPGNIMVSLQVVDDQELNKGPHGNKSVNQKEILNKDKMGKDPEVVILSGDAGSGKTTILRSYAEGWCKKTTDMPELSSFPLLLNMQFRNHDHDNFDDYLKSLIPKTIAQFPFDLVKSVVLGSKCLVLCDGYDEYNINSRKLFGNILALASNKMKFVVTTRPGNTEELTKIVNQGKRSRINLKVSGLQKKDMKLLAEKLIGHLMKDDDVTQQEQMKKELLQKIAKMETGTRDILQTPLYFNLFILLYIECPELRDEMSTRSSVYLQLRQHKIKRISDKTGISEKSLEEFDALCRKWSLKYCIEEKYEWSEADVRSFKMEINSPELLQNFEAIMSSYFSIKNTKKQQEIVKVYCHRHRSEQEFAAAGSICDDIITSIGRRPQGGGNFIRDLLQY